MSPLSSNAPDEMDQEQEHEPEQDGTNTGGRTHDEGSAPESAVTEKQQQQPPKTPPQPFNFGTISKDMVGMKITQAASMDTRLGSLEARMGRLERAVDQLCHAVPGFKTPLVETPAAAAPGPTSDPSSHAAAYYTSTAAPPMIPAVYQTMSSDLSRSSETESQHSHLSFGEAPTYIGSLHPPSSSSATYQTGSLTATATAPLEPPPTLNHRPPSTSTVRGTTSLPTLPRTSSDSYPNPNPNPEDTPPTPTQQSHLLLSHHLDAERLARQSLEAQVAKLSQRLNTLSATMYAMVRSKSQEHLLLRPPTPPVPLPRTSDLTVTDDDEQFVTPGEERSTLGYHHRPGGGGGYGDEEEEEVDDGEEDDDDTLRRKKAARTLSLGQLTLGKKGNQQQQVRV